jgi:hypothetical protein
MRTMLICGLLAIGVLTTGGCTETVSHGGPVYAVNRAPHYESYRFDGHAFRFHHDAASMHR